MIRVTDIFEGRVNMKAAFYAADMNDAIAMARLLARSGYHVQIGPMNEYTTGVRVNVWERHVTEMAQEEDRNHESS